MVRKTELYQTNTKSQGLVPSMIISIVVHVVTFGLKTSLHVLGEHNGTKTELYRTNTKSQGLVPSMIISIVVHVVKHQSVLICRRQVA